MIRHTVAFRLQHPAGSPEEAAFLAKAMELKAIPSVRKFEQLRQVSKKSAFTHGFSMEFDDQAGYDAYTFHRSHVSFVQTCWIPEVADFQEIDYVAL